ncbi:uncharacterized protein B0T15DRAFT_119292 [Chaetomium strumarium]|uniref:GAR domain-containing protein n=1 Tax=Chaetomium strumarium TaxID=1170767 RepID=A0AAJ0GZ33_9PEZI|nr:hypothetical protein B0T15DRAFT_119292 [Chaetomium strumarium]
MNESPPAQSPAHLAPTRGRHLRSTSSYSSYSQARQRTTDDLLSNLTPRTVVDAFRNPSGSLKACIDAATPTEQAFALRVAVAANSIHEWLEELSAWSWPAGGGSAGFEVPTVKRRLFSSGSELSGNGSQHSHQEYIGSLPAADVATYERRLDKIAQELEELDIEEIKNQVLNNHIMPLSRPGTPMMDCGRSAMSFSIIARLDDLTALITATTVGALPMLSKLTKLMESWTFRLLVLRRVPVFLTSLVDAEVALQSGWNAIRLGANPSHGAGTDNSTPGTEPAALHPGEFEVMKSVLERKVAKAGHDLDAMLDLLEGQPDTLPEEWIDRVDALEHGYGEWTVACESRIKETDLARLAPQFAPVTATPEQPVHQGPHNSTVATRDSAIRQSQDTEFPSRPASSLNEGATGVADRQSDVPPPVIKIHPTADEQALQPEDDDYIDTEDERAQSSSDGSARLEPSASEASHQHSTGDLGGAGRSLPASDVELSDISECGARQAGHGLRRGSNGSEASTIIHEAPSTFTGSFSSDDLDQGTPEHRRQTDAEREDVVPSLPSLRPSGRSLSVSFSETTTITELPSFSSPPGTPTTSAIPEDDVATEPDSPSEMSISGMDDQLQQQISEILESVPAKIRLTREPPAINLNPPDFKMPTARKSSRSDAIPRSQSNISMRSAYSRSGTPSFTLAPAYGRNSRLRHQRSNQEIKLYHLSRSNGEAPIKLFIRCVGEHGERVMVRVGGGWADLGEYLKEYASHHLRRAAVGSAQEDKVEVKDIPRTGAARADATPPSRPTSAMDAHSPVSPLRLRKTRRPTASGTDEPPLPLLQPATRPKTPLASASRLDATPPSDASSRSRSSTRSLWDEEDDSSALGMAGPRAKQIEMSEESRAWVESVKEKVRIASSDRPKPPPVPVLHRSVSSGSLGQAEAGLEASLMDRGDGSKGKGGPAGAMFGEMGKVGSTKRLFRRGQDGKRVGFS